MDSNNETPQEKQMENQFERPSRRRRVLWRLGFFAILLAKGVAVMLLWNFLVPELFHGPEIYYGQALGLMILAKLLVGFGGRPGFGHWGGHRHHRGGHHWRRHEMWAQMSEEERKKLRDEFRPHHR